MIHKEYDAHITVTNYNYYRYRIPYFHLLTLPISFYNYQYLERSHHIHRARACESGPAYSHRPGVFSDSDIRRLRHLGGQQQDQENHHEIQRQAGRL